VSLTYERVHDLAESLEVMGRHGAGAVPLAGGTDVVPHARARRIERGVLLDISRVDELRGVEFAVGFATIGSLVTAAQLAESHDVVRAFPSLAAAAGSLGSPQVRNRATVGGNVVNASPAADLALALTALDAEVVLASSAGRRTLPLDGFFVGPGLTRRSPDELVVGFRVPVRPEVRAVFTKVGLRRSLACALVNLSVVVVPADDGRSCTAAAIALGAVAPVCFRARRAESMLVRRDVDADVFANVAAAAADEARPISDVRGSAAYRRHLVAVYVERALAELFPAARRDSAPDGGSDGARGEAT
jgi:CO/xanthine dehydrogenase FAD-binding subunit